MRVLVVPGPGESGLLCELDDDGNRRGSPVEVDDLAGAIASREADAPVRWVWFASASLYPALLRAGVRVSRCHDVALAETLLRGRDQLTSDGPDLELSGPEPERDDDPGAAQQALFEPIQAGARVPPPPGEAIDALAEAHAGQVARIAADERPDRFGLLVAAESAGGLAAAEMTLAGLPWRADVHDALLTDLLGPRPAGHPGRASSRPAKLADLAAEISAAFGPGDAVGRARQPVNPDSPAQLLRALAADGIWLPSTRMAVLSGVDHPAIAPLLEYKELSRLHSAFGWAWLDSWVRDGRFRSEYVVGGVVSGRWASRGGGALQIPRLLRRAVVADPGWVLVVADAAQLEPRVLAALAGDRGLAAAATGRDLYAEVAGAFGGDRAKAKVALLSAMYGGAGGEAGQLLAVLRQRFPAAAGYVEAAARAGEEGRVVRSVLGRTCPPPSAGWRALTLPGEADAEPDPRASRASRARGRFTRNFVVQASAADWALVMLVSLRADLERTFRPNGPPTSDQAAGLTSLQPRAESTSSAAGPSGAIGATPAQLVFFQHDEVIVHCPREQADAVVGAVARAGDEATRLVFGPTPVAFPLNVSVVDCYADAK